MTKIILIVFLVLSYGLFSPIYAQTTTDKLIEEIKDYSKKSQKNILSMQILKSASKIIYSFNNGTVHPDSYYVGYIVVTPNIVTLEIRHKSEVCYSNYRFITSDRYSIFLNALYSLGIKSNHGNQMFMTGDSVRYLTIESSSTVVFEGAENYDIVTTNGYICDAFEPLLTDAMRKAYNDPTSTFTVDEPDYILNN